VADAEWPKHAAAEQVWRVQAFWTVRDERKNYRPILCNGRDAAERTAEEMAVTLSHFPTLEIVVAPATEDDLAQGEWL
jgi:hypothetical protein